VRVRDHDEPTAASLVDPAQPEQAIAVAAASTQWDGLGHIFDHRRAWNGRNAADVFIGEMWDTEALAADCAADGRYEFWLTAAPIPVTGAVGAPANPIAVK
jgi:hypothetical protein